MCAAHIDVIRMDRVCSKLMIYEWSGTAARLEWNSVISASAETHRNPRVHIVSLLDYFQEKRFPTNGGC